MIATTRPDIANVTEQTVLALKDLEARIGVLKGDLATLCQGLGHPEAARVAAAPTFAPLAPPLPGGIPPQAAIANGLNPYAAFAPANVPGLAVPSSPPTFPSAYAPTYPSAYANAFPSAYASPFATAGYPPTAAAPGSLSPYVGFAPYATPFASPFAAPFAHPYAANAAAFGAGFAGPAWTTPLAAAAATAAGFSPLAAQVPPAGFR